MDAGAVSRNNIAHGWFASALSIRQPGRHRRVLIEMSKSGNFRWVICALLFSSVAINYIDRLVIGILKKPLSEQLGWNDSDYGNIAAAFSFAYAFG
jgi:sugar phosphate permease